MSKLSLSIEEDIRAAEPGWCECMARCRNCGKGDADGNRWAIVFPVEANPTESECPDCGARATQLLDRETLKPIE